MTEPYNHLPCIYILAHSTHENSDYLLTPNVRVYRETFITDMGFTFSKSSSLTTCSSVQVKKGHLHHQLKCHQRAMSKVILRVLYLEAAPSEQPHFAIGFGCSWPNISWCWHWQKHSDQTCNKGFKQWENVYKIWMTLLVRRPYLCYMMPETLAFVYDLNNNLLPQPNM